MSRELARELVREYGWNTTCWQILNPGIQLWFSADRRAVVGYVRAGSYFVVAGAPVCEAARLRETISEWESWADCRICYFGAERRLQELFAGDGSICAVSLGAQPLWRPENWVDRVSHDAGLRYQLSRARSKGVVVEEWPADKVIESRELRACLHKWLASRGLPTMHFLVEPDTLGQPEDRRYFVGTRDGAVVAFVTLSPIPQRNGWLTEQFPRIPEAPNGSVELVLDTAVRSIAQTGADLVTMGIVPLSRHGRLDPQESPGWLRAVSAWTAAHGKRFYNFEGLDRFKEKFHPDEYEPVRVYSRERRFRPATLYAVAEAFAGRAPWRPLLRATTWALREELRFSMGRKRFSP